MNAANGAEAMAKLYLPIVSVSAAILNLQLKVNQFGSRFLFHSQIVRLGSDIKCYPWALKISQSINLYSPWLTLRESGSFGLFICHGYHRRGTVFWLGSEMIHQLHIHTLTNLFTIFRKTSISLSAQIQMENESSEILLNQERKQTMRLQGTKVRKASTAA